MKEPKFTKGPWVRNNQKQEWSVSADNSDSSFDSIDSQSRDCPIAFVVHDDWRDDEEMNANSHLIAAAPEIYEMLNAIASGGSVATYEIQELLAKARGES